MIKPHISNKCPTVQPHHIQPMRKPFGKNMLGTTPNGAVQGHGFPPLCSSAVAVTSRQTCAEEFCKLETFTSNLMRRTHIICKMMSAFCVFVAGRLLLVFFASSLLFGPFTFFDLCWNLLLDPLLKLSICTVLDFLTGTFCMNLQPFFGGNLQKPST